MASSVLALLATPAAGELFFGPDECPCLAADALSQAPWGPLNHAADLAYLTAGGANVTASTCTPLPAPHGPWLRAHA